MNVVTKQEPRINVMLAQSTYLAAAHFLVVMFIYTKHFMVVSE